MYTYKRNQHDLKRNTLRMDVETGWKMGGTLKRQSLVNTLQSAFTTGDGIGQTGWPDAGGRQSRNRCQTRIKPASLTT